LGGLVFFLFKDILEDSMAFSPFPLELIAFPLEPKEKSRSCITLPLLLL